MNALFRIQEIRFRNLSLSYFSYLLHFTYYDIVPAMDRSSRNHKKFLGITTLGEKGQMVIPAEARAALKLVKGEKLIVMGAHEDTFVVMKASRFEAMASHFTKHLASVRKLIKKEHSS
jgi:AbrB family looped-hinge helix DNA binding protein